jgi:hypothetical protein
MDRAFKFVLESSMTAVISTHLLMMWFLKV